MNKLDAKGALKTLWMACTNGADWPFVTEYKAHPTRNWRLDWAYINLKLAVEIDGVSYKGQGLGHQTGKAFEANCEKLNALTELGWTILRYTPDMLNRDGCNVINQILTVAERLRGNE